MKREEMIYKVAKHLDDLYELYMYIDKHPELNKELADGNGSIQTQLGVAWAALETIMQYEE